jgi:hypothetical protein
MSPVAVIVVTWNSASVLPGFLAALSDGMAGLDWRLVVADNDSADDTVKVLRRLAPDAEIVQTGRNAGYAAGVNAALAAAGEHDAVLICNPDIRMRQGCAKRLVDSLGGGVGIAVPLLYEEGRDVPHFSLRRESSVLRALGEAVIGNQRAGRFPWLSELVTDPAAYRAPTRADWATSFCTPRRPSTACGRGTGGMRRSWNRRRRRCTWGASPGCRLGCGHCWWSTGCGCTGVGMGCWRRRCFGGLCCSGRCRGRCWGGRRVGPLWSRSCGAAVAGRAVLRAPG